MVKECENCSGDHVGSVLGESLNQFEGRIRREKGQARSRWVPMAGVLRKPVIGKGRVQTEEHNSKLTRRKQT